MDSSLKEELNGIKIYFINYKLKKKSTKIDSKYYYENIDIFINYLKTPTEKCNLVKNKSNWSYGTVRKRYLQHYRNIKK